MIRAIKSVTHLTISNVMIREGRVAGYPYFFKIGIKSWEMNFNWIGLSLQIKLKINLSKNSFSRNIKI